MGQQLFSDHIKCGTTLFCQHSPQAILSISYAHVLLLLFGNAFGVGSLRKKITSKERCIFISSLPFGLRGPHRIQGTSDKWQGNHAAFLLTFLCGHFHCAISWITSSRTSITLNTPLTRVCGVSEVYYHGH